MSNDIDIFGDAEDVQVNETALSELSDEINNAIQTDQRIEDLQRELKALNEVQNRRIEETIPDLMDQAGVQEFKAHNRKVSLQEKLYGSLPKDDERRAEILERIRELGQDSIIKNTVMAELGRESTEAAEKIAKFLSELGFTPKFKQDVPHNTLQKVARELMEKGELGDPGELGLYNRRFAKIT